MKRFAPIVGTVASFLAFIYSLLGIVMAMWISAVPGNSPEHVRSNYIFWICCAVVTLLLTTFGTLYLLGRNRS